MENLSLPSASPVNSLESNAGNKADCYFYYYSSCNKGNTCPFRHEPSALRNETMCVYWLKGSCNKPHCIYRHMEIKKNRNKIPCFFESQPGGCKKLHCPFFHNNILDQPREEDVPNNPDLILPVKDSEMEYETEESELKKIQDSVASQLRLHRKMSDSQNSLKENKEKDKESSFTVPIPSNVQIPFIVRLQDGESDSESVTPVKSSESNRRCVFTSDWELEKLKEIQREERDLLGFTFYDDGEDNKPLEESQLSEEEECQEYIEEEHMSYTFIRKTFEESKPTLSQLITLPKENFGGLAKRAIGEVLMGNKRIKSNHEKSIAHDSCSSETDSNHLGRRIRLKDSPKKKISAKERLGVRSSQKIRENDDNPIANKKEEIDQLRLQQGNVKRRLDLNEDKSKLDSSKNGHSDFVIKSLAEIKAEKNKEISKSNGNLKKNLSTGLLPLSAYINNSGKASKDSSNNASVEEIKIKTLDEIRAEKKSKVTKNGNKKISHTSSRAKRSHSTISFETGFSKKLKSTSDKEIGIQKSLLNNFQSRKLSLKKSPTKSVSVSSTNSELNNRAQLEKQNSPTNVNNIILKRNLNHEVVDKQNGTNDKLNNSSMNSSKLDISKRRESTDNSGNNHSLHTSRLDSFVDEEELLLLDDSVSINVDVDDIDEEELLS